MSPDIVKKVIKETGYRIVQSNLDNDFEKNPTDNMYYMRDIIMVLELN